jgi:hypothetical protein
MTHSEALRAILSEIAGLLESGNQDWRPVAIRDALSGSEAILEEFLVSNELWGGAGSIADEGCILDNARRKILEGLLIKLGKLQIEAGKTNVRTEMWVTAFQKDIQREA